jgi:hypothetical protein
MPLILVSLSRLCALLKLLGSGLTVSVGELKLGGVSSGLDVEVVLADDGVAIYLISLCLKGQGLKRQLTHRRRSMAGCQQAA